MPIFRRQSCRLKNYDYSKNGYYFITICTKDRQNYFGNIINGKMILSDIGKIAQKCWLEIPKHFKNVELDEYKIMPDHMHGMVVIKNTNKIIPPGRGVACNAPTGGNVRMSKISPKTGSLGSIIRSYKSAVRRWCGMNGYQNFSWQGRYYDRIIRNEESLNKIRRYIKFNVLIEHKKRKGVAYNAPPF